MINAPIQTSNKLIFASYSRKFETEADTESIVIAAAAGYNPKAMINILSHMDEAIEEPTGYKASKSYFSDHPFTPDRNKNVRKQAANLKVNPSKPVDWTVENDKTEVGAYHPNKKAAIFLNIEQSGLTPEQAGKEFLKNLKDEYKSKLTDAKAYELKRKKGYLITFTESTGKETMYAYVLWLSLNGKLFKFIGITPIKYRSLLEKSKGNENMEEWSKRTGNKLNSQLTAIINLVNLHEKILKGTLIKIVLEKPYLTKLEYQ